MVPLSRGSYACIAATFFSISLLVANGNKPKLAYVVGFFICFFCTLGAGFLDTYRYRKTQRLRDSRRNEGL